MVAQNIVAEMYLANDFIITGFSDKKIFAMATLKSPK